MFYGISGRSNIFKRGNTDFEVAFGVECRDFHVAFVGFDASGDHGLVGDEEQRAAGDAVVESHAKERCTFHVDGHGADAHEVLLEVVIELPHAPVGGEHGARPVIDVGFFDFFRCGAL